jgi:hypothetical protein
MWLQELALLKEGIIAKINSAVGRQVIKDIVFRVGDPDKERSDGDKAETGG